MKLKKTKQNKTVLGSCILGVFFVVLLFLDLSTRERSSLGLQHASTGLTCGSSQSEAYMRQLFWNLTLGTFGVSSILECLLLPLFVRPVKGCFCFWVVNNTNRNAEAGFAACNSQQQLQLAHFTTTTQRPLWNKQRAKRFCSSSPSALTSLLTIQPSPPRGGSSV